MQKKKCLKEKCALIEKQKDRDIQSMHNSIREITGKRKCCQSGCIKSKDGQVLMEKAEIMARWKEYIEELYHDERGRKPRIRMDIDRPSTLENEVREAIKYTKNNKAPGPDELKVELIKCLEDFGVQKLTEIINDIYNSGAIPEDLSRSIFVTLPKKPGTTDCECHRTISLMSHVTKILLRILTTRARNKIRPEISESQCGFVADSGTRNAIFMMRMLSERAIEMKKDLFVCFIDYSKAFDTVKHEKLTEMLQMLNMDGKDIRIMRNMYWEQTAAVRIDGETSDFISIKKGVRQGCVWSPDFWNLYAENIFRAVEEMPGLGIGGHNVNNIRYADDTTLITALQIKVQGLLDEVVLESSRMGLSLNCKKTQCMVI